MSEGTGVGSIFLDLIVRDTVGKQVQDIAAKGQATAQKAFSGMERAAETAVNNVTAQTGKLTQKATAAATQATNAMVDSVQKASERVTASLNGSFSKPVELAKLKLKQLEQEFADLSTKSEAVMRNDTSFKMYGYVSDDNKEFKNLEKQLDSLYRRMETARARLSIETQAAAQKQAVAEESAAQKATAAAERAALKQQMAAQRAAEKAAAAATRSAAKREAEERRAATAAEKAAQRAVAAEEKAANRRRKILASMWKNMLSYGGNALKSISGKITGIIKQFSLAGKGGQRFGSRLREIAASALIFNGISSALRSMVSYLGEGITASDEMKQALANLKGAAANAASPIIQVLTPALTALANTAATVLYYIGQLITKLTGKVSNAAALAQKNSNKAVKSAKKAEAAMKSLASFDSIERLSSNSSGAEDDSEEETDDTIEPNYGFVGESPFLDSVLAAIDGGKWQEVGALFAEKLNSTLEAIPWDSIQEKAHRWTQNLVDTLNGFIHKVDWGLIGTTLGEGLNTIAITIDTFFQGIRWIKLGRNLATSLNQLFSTIDWETLGRVLTDKFKALFDMLYGFVSEFNFSEFGTYLAQLINAALDNIEWGQLWETFKAGVAGLIDAAIAFLKEADGETLGILIGALLISAIKAGLKAAANILGPKIKKQIVDKFMSSLNGSLIPKLTAAFTKIGTWITSTLIPKISAGLAAISSALGVSVGWVVAIGAAVAALVAVIVKHWDEIVEWTKKAWEKIKEIWDKVASWFDEKVIGPIKEFFSNLWEKVSNFASEAWDKIKEIWNNVASWFQENVVDPIKDAFSAVYDFISDIWNSIVGFIKNAINNVIGAINGMISGIISGINAAIRALNKLSFTVPEWLKNVPGASGIAGKKFGFNLQELTAPQIPMLAGGGVITQPTLAMMGEYAGAKSNPEIVAPQSMMAETVTAVMEDVMSRYVMGFEEVVAVLREILQAVLGIEIGDEVIGKAAARYNRRMSRAGGY